MMIERLKAEGVIDVFQTVQAMRLQRPAMVQTAVRQTNVNRSAYYGVLSRTCAQKEYCSSASI